MEISFDPIKRALTLADRGLDFANAARVFAAPVFEFEKANEREQTKFRGRLA